MAENGEFLTCRKILCLMVITCFMVNYMLRVNMSIAIVDMVYKNLSNKTQPETTYQWNEHQKNNVLGIFFCGYCLSAFPGGRLSEIYGTRIVLGGSTLIASILTFLTPIACFVHYYYVIFVRFALGLALGAAWPSVLPLAVKWVAPTDSTKFLSHTIAASVGAALTLPVCGYIIAGLGWPSVFYITGALSMIWTILWFYLVYDSPRQHPRISREEKEKIENETKRDNFVEKVQIPWMKILTSGPVWATIITNMSFQFNIYINLNEIPSYMDKVLHFDIKSNGLLSSLPFIMTYIMAVASTTLADKWRKSGKFSIITIRKLFTWIAFIIPSLFYIIQAIWGYDRFVSIFVFSLTQGFLAFVTAGCMANPIDISPRYCGTVSGIGYMCGAFTSFISSKVVDLITSSEVTFNQWRYIFVILVVVNMFGSVFYQLFASGAVQDWNSKNVKSIELDKLNK